jgi:hypothetical protein
MTLRLNPPSPWPGGFYKALAEGEKPIARPPPRQSERRPSLPRRAGASASPRPASAAMAERTALRVYPPGRDSTLAAAPIYHKVPYAQLFEEGAVIHGKYSCGCCCRMRRSAQGGRRIPAAEFQQQVGTPLYTIRRPGKQPMVGANVQI